jgi:hypothetical protein
MQDFKLMETGWYPSPRPTFSNTEQKESPQPTNAGASICSLVETGEGWPRPFRRRPESSHATPLTSLWARIVNPVGSLR